MNLSVTTPDLAEIHVVDPDPAVREGLQTLLSILNARVYTYPNAEAFLANSPPTALGCLIAEVHLPGITGIELLQRLREQQVNLPVILLACNSNVPMAVHAMRMGAVDFLEKPFVDRLLLKRVRKVLESMPVQ